MVQQRPGLLVFLLLALTSVTHTASAACLPLGNECIELSLPDLQPGDLFPEHDEINSVHPQSGDACLIDLSAIPAEGYTVGQVYDLRITSDVVASDVGPSTPNGLAMVWLLGPMSGDTTTAVHPIVADITLSWTAPDSAMESFYAVCGALGNTKQIHVAASTTIFNKDRTSNLPPKFCPLSGTTSAGCTYTDLGCVLESGNTKLNCRNQTIYGRVYITDLPATVTSIDMSMNEITWVNPKTWKRFVYKYNGWWRYAYSYHAGWYQPFSIQHIDLSNNLLRNIDDLMQPTEFPCKSTTNCAYTLSPSNPNYGSGEWGLTTLKTLHVQNNLITSLKYNAFEAGTDVPSTLSDVNINDNPLDFVMANCDLSPNTKILSCNNKFPSTMHYLNFQHMPRIHTLDLSNNQLRTIEPHMWRHSQLTLKSIDVSMNQLASINVGYGTHTLVIANWNFGSQQFQGATVTQANGYMIWTLTVTGAEEVEQAQGVPVTQTSESGTVVNAGTLTTALAASGDALTTITVTTVIGQFFDVNHPVVIGTTGSRTTILANDVTTATAITTPHAVGTFKMAVVDLTPVSGNPITSTVTISSEPGTTAFDSMTRLVIGKTKILAADLNTYSFSTPPAPFTKGIKYLRTFKMNNNSVAHLDYNQFQDNAQLLDVDLTTNPLDYLQKGCQLNKDISELNCEFLNLSGVVRFQDVPSLRLKIVKMSNNYIEDIHEDTFGRSIQLEEVDLSFNNLTLTEEDVHRYYQLFHRSHSTLERIYLDSNNISSIGRMTEHMTELSVLRLNNNEISALSPWQFVTNTKLQVVTLNSNPLDFLLAGCALSVNLKILDCKSQGIVGIVNYLDVPSCWLEKVDFEDNQITGINPAMWYPANTTLKELYLSKNNITDIMGLTKGRLELLLHCMHCIFAGFIFILFFFSFSRLHMQPQPQPSPHLIKLPCPALFLFIDLCTSFFSLAGMSALARLYITENPVARVPFRDEFLGHMKSGAQWFLGFTFRDGSKWEEDLHCTKTIAFKDNEGRDVCHLEYCNAHEQLKRLFCDGLECTTSGQAVKCKNHWYNFGIDDQLVPNIDSCYRQETLHCNSTYLFGKIYVNDIPEKVS